MSAATSADTSVPFTVESIHFDFPGGRAIHLRDHVTDSLIGDNPEWVVGIRNELSAFVRDTRPNFRVVFRGGPDANGQYLIGAAGTIIDVEQRSVLLTFDPDTELSSPEEFEASGTLPDLIGIHDIELDWYACEQSSPEIRLPTGEVICRIATNWRALAIAAAGEPSLENWVYKPLMEWTCLWASGQGSEQAICNAILKNLPRSGLRYGVSAQTIRDLLLNQGGMCGVWYQTFQQMAQCQGVFVYRRCFYVDWRNVGGGEEHWCAIVIKNGGLNQALPTPPRSTFNDHTGVFPIPAGTTVPITTIEEPRYRFWGLPGFNYDGHCINFLVYEGKIFLYDACFGLGPIEIDSPIPADNPAVPQGGADLAAFKAAYLDHAIDFMLGTVRNGPTVLESIYVYPPGLPITNGMTVRTANIPETVAGLDGLTFRWGI